MPMPKSFEDFILHTDLALIYATNAVDSADLGLVARGYIGLMLREARLRYEQKPNEAADDLFRTAAIEASEKASSVGLLLDMLPGQLPDTSSDVECATVMPKAKVLMLADAPLKMRKIKGLTVGSTLAEFLRDVNDAIGQRLLLPENTRPFWLADHIQLPPLASSTPLPDALRDWLALDHLPLGTDHDDINLCKLVFPYNETIRASVRRPSSAAVPGRRFRARTDVEAKSESAVNSHGFTVNIDESDNFKDAAPEIHAAFSPRVTIEGARFESVGVVSPRPPRYDQHKEYLSCLLRGRTGEEILDSCKKLEDGVAS